MDPDANLIEQRKIVAQVLELIDADISEDSRTELCALYAAQLAERVRALDEWITKGGFLPVAWRQPLRIPGTRP